MGTSIITAVVELDQSKFKTKVFAGGHLIYADEPTELGGSDEGMTPGALLLASLGSCTAITMRMYADRKEIPLEGIKIDLAISNESDMSNETEIIRKIELLGSITDAQRTRLMTIADKCPIHKLLSNPIRITTL